jgi:hypothetical protein
VLLDEHQSDQFWRAAVGQVLDSFGAEARVLVELCENGETNEPQLCAFFERKNGRVEGVGVLALHVDAAGRRVPAAISSV